QVINFMRKSPAFRFGSISTEPADPACYLVSNVRFAPKATDRYAHAKCREGPGHLYGAIVVKAVRSLLAGLRHLLVPPCFPLGCCAERRSRVAEGHRGATCP